MKIYKTFKKQKKPTAIALGFFDGIHLGHQKIISKTVECSKVGLKPCVFTFLQNPKTVLENQKINYLMTNDDKIEALEKFGIEAVYMLNFNDVKSMSPEDFAERVLKQTLNAKMALCGFNYHFGSGGTANADDLKNLCSKCGIEVYVQPPVNYDGWLISSSRIRNAVEKHDYEAVNKMLDNDKFQ